MTNDAYELIALTARYFFAGMMLLIVLRAAYLTLVDSRRAARLRRLSPMTGLSGELIVLEGDERARRGMRYPVIREGMIGSSRSADVRVRHSSVRRRHAYFQLTRQGLSLRSHAGARLYDRDDRAVREVLLRDGEEVRIGRVRLLLILSEVTAEQAGRKARGDGLSDERRAALRSRHGDDLFGETSMTDFVPGPDEFDRLDGDSGLPRTPWDDEPRAGRAYAARDDESRNGRGYAARDDESRAGRAFAARDDESRAGRGYAVRDDETRNGRGYAVRDDETRVGRAYAARDDESRAGASQLRRGGAAEGSFAERRAAEQARRERRDEFRRTMGLEEADEPPVSRTARRDGASGLHSAARRASGTGASRASGADRMFFDESGLNGGVHRDGASGLNGAARRGSGTGASRASGADGLFFDESGLSGGVHRDGASGLHSAARRASGTGASRASGADGLFSDGSRPVSRGYTLDGSSGGRVASRETPPAEDPFDGIIRAEGAPRSRRKTSAEDGIPRPARRRTAERSVPEDDLFMSDRD